MCIQIKYTFSISLSILFWYNLCVFNSNGRKQMKAEELRKLTKKKSKTINLRINPDLLKLLDEAIAKDKDYDSRNELVEVLVLRYLESKGKI